MFVNGNVFMIMSEMKLKFVTAEHIKNGQKEILVKV